MSRKAPIALACCVLGLGLVPASASATPALVNKLAAQACAAEKSKLGKKAFAKRYSGKRPAKVCIKRTKPKARASVTEATDECLWELNEYGDEEFYAEWGSFTACVSDYAAWIMDGGSFEEEAEDEEEPDEGLL